MRIVKTVDEMRQARPAMSGSVGFIPTMGFLHEGHLALVRRARTETDNLVVSIFVNPTQFGPKEDFTTYPRDTERDLELLRKEKTDLVFMPGSEEIYPQNFNSWIDVEGLTERLEGAFRPGHFRGVTTVVAKLFNIVQPHKTYFGRKDAQQLLVIRKMAADLNMNIEVIDVPTVREPDGLAMSSRNSYLNPQEREAALVLWKSLTRAEELWQAGEESAKRIRDDMISIISAESLASIDYVSVANPDTLEELDGITGSALVSLAVRIGKTRLIDNITLIKGDQNTSAAIEPSC